MTSTAHTNLQGHAAPWNLGWLTPIRCRLILVLVLGLGAFSHVNYLNHNCPVDLSGDEAQYWDWSRQLELSYYSKGPLVAYIIRASCAIFGNTMPAVRYPALALGVGTSIITYLLTRKLFGSERLALGTVLMFHLVPMFIAGSVLMTIDPPMFFCWALASYFAASAILDKRKWMWLAVGIAIGFGFLAKYAEFLWFIGLFGFLIVHHDRRNLKWAFVSLGIACLFLMPVIIWNNQHDWVSLRHVARQTGASEGGFSILNPLEMIGTQFGAVGPTISLFMIGGIVYTTSKRFSRDDPNRQKLLLLAWLGLPFWALNLITSFRAKVQPNWPAPAYFTLMIVTGYFLATRLKSKRSWKPWRVWFYATVVIGLVCIPVSHDSAVMFPLVRKIAGPKFDLKKIDFLARLRGYAGLGQFVSNQLMSMPPDTFVLCHDYQQTAEMAFYVQGQPKTYCAGPYIEKMRFSQYDMWPDRGLDETSRLVGKDAVYVSRIATFPEALAKAFERIEPTQNYPVIVDGVTVRGHAVWRCYGFKGLPRPGQQSRDY